MTEVMSSDPLLDGTLGPLPLKILSLRILFRIESPLQLPRWKGSMLHGGLGRALKAALCDPGCSDSTSCINSNCPYRTIFAPEAEAGQAAARGLHDIPRPYAVRPPLGSQVSFRPGDLLPFGLTLIGTATEFLPHILHAFRELGQMGIGEQRGRACLHKVESYDPLTAQTLSLFSDGVLHNGLLFVTGEGINRCVSAAPATVRLHFHGPMRLKNQGSFATIPECHLLVRAALRRLSSLSTYFGSGEWAVPYRRLIELASAVPLREGRTHWVDWSRTSGASGQHMTLGGFVGQATYDQVPPSIRAVLLAGSLVHIGKSSVFGHGAYSLETLT